MNRFTIEEDDQFEIAGIQTIDYRHRNDETDMLDKAIQGIKSYRKALSLPNEIFANQLHIICTDEYFGGQRPRYMNGYYGLSKNFIRAIKRYGYKSVMISRIQMFKCYCITKEQFDMVYA